MQGPCGQGYQTAEGQGTCSRDLPLLSSSASWSSPEPPLSIQTPCKAGAVPSNLPVPPSWALERDTEQLLPALTLAAGGLQAGEGII